MNKLKSLSRTKVVLLFIILSASFVATWRYHLEQSRRRTIDAVLSQIDGSSGGQGVINGFHQYWTFGSESVPYLTSLIQQSAVDRWTDQWIERHHQWIVRHWMKLPVWIQRRVYRNEPEFRYKIIWILSEMGVKAQHALPVLRKIYLSDPDSASRMNAFSAMARIGISDPEVLHLLTMAGTNQTLNSMLRVNAAAFLGSRKPSKEGIAALIQMARDTNVEIRAMAFASLGRQGTNAHEALPLLIEALTNASQNVRTTAAWSLPKVAPDDASIVPPLEALLRDPDEQMVRTAKEALKSIRAEGPRQSL